MNAVDQIKSLMKEQKQDQISKQLLLQSLQEQGIRDLDAFATRTVEMVKNSAPQPLSALIPELKDRNQEQAVIELLFGSKAQSIAKDVQLSQPRLPFALGGAVYQPAEIQRFNGKPLHFVWNSEMAANGFLTAVTDPEEYRDQLFGQQSQTATRHHVPGAGHSFYQHINFGGHVLNLPYRHAFPDLTTITMSGFWFWATSWNDQMSSLRTGSGPVLLAEHVMRPYLTGATLSIPAFSSVAWIGQAWNDRVSAILG